MKKNTSYTEILRQENEITKLKIQAEFGIELNNEEELNPIIESIWLNQILEYERSMINNKKITVGEMLDYPICKAVEEIGDDEVSVELQKIMELLRHKNIVVDSIHGIDDMEMYRFITQELFLKETDSNFPKNMIVCFVYEEFYPNDESDIKIKTNEFIHALIDKEETFIDRYFVSFDDEEKESAFQKMKRRIILFRDAFDEICLEEFNITSLDIIHNSAEVLFDFKLSVMTPGGKVSHLISGPGKYKFVKENNYWILEEVFMNGIA